MVSKSETTKHINYLVLYKQFLTNYSMKLILILFIEYLSLLQLNIC